MNKALHVFVYLFLIGVGFALWYEYQLNDKRTELKDRNRMMEDFLVSQISPLVEKGDDYEPVDSPNEILLDDDSVTDHTKIDPSMVDILADVDGYDFSLEKLEHNILTWGEPERMKLREIYIYDAEGKPQMDGAEKLTRGSGEETTLKSLVDALKRQRDQFEKTRKAIPPLREKLKEVADMYNAVTPQLRAYVATNISQKASIEDLTAKNTALTEKQTEYENQIKEKEIEIVSLRDEIETAKNETEVVKEDLEKQTKQVENLQNQIKALIQQRNQLGREGAGGTALAVNNLPIGDKGSVIYADKENMFAIVELTPETMKQLKGDDLARPMPMIELGVKRPGFSGPAGEFVGRIRIRQEVAGKNYVTCDILSNWEQDPLTKGDVVFAE